MKFAFAGFRHGHIFAMHQLVSETDALEITACCEEDAKTREDLKTAGTIDVTHGSLDAMLTEADCDVVAIGDYYGARGRTAIAALRAGKHIIADKPICTSLNELDEIKRLADEKNLKVGCMLDLRGRPQFIKARELVRSGILGEMVAASFGGQHPLSLGSRPAWYFEKGKHGGTINDLALHGIDALEWITGMTFDTVRSARVWNTPMAAEFPEFKDAAQMMLTMSNGCGVLGDVSYSVPDSLGYAHSLYWRITLWGSKGVLETNVSADSV
ncbi:MAG: Gfo/Idh/MocA family oxidoreductase, partial [Victivallales bacterium]|nr:Gfo/Idh/MocA family oxidoreductase [Victivallales bacterium]